MTLITIYHYTSLSAFEKIIESGRIRAMHYRDFSDKEELQLECASCLTLSSNIPSDCSDREYRDFLVEGIEAFARDDCQCTSCRSHCAIQSITGTNMRRTV